MSNFWAEQRRKYGNGQVIYTAVENAIAGVSFRRQVFAAFYEQKIYELYSGEGVEELSFAELMEARQFKQPFSQDEIMERLKQVDYVFNAKHLGEQQ